MIARTSFAEIGVERGLDCGSLVLGNAGEIDEHPGNIVARPLRRVDFMTLSVEQHVGRCSPPSFGQGYEQGAGACFKEASHGVRQSVSPLLRSERDGSRPNQPA
jgi:hypothetical protein